MSRPPGPEATETAATNAAGESHQETAELAEMRAQLREANETIEAIRSGAVDSLVIGPPGKEEVYSLASTDRPYRLIVEAMNEGAATVSERGVILNANERLAAMVGRPAAELIGTPVIDLVHDGHRASSVALLDIGTGDSTRGEVELGAPGHVTIPVLLAVSGFDLDGMSLRCLVLTDLTRQRQAEAEVRALNADLEARVQQRTAELEQANKNLEAFTSSVAHDLRAPLRAMSGYSEMLLQEYSDVLGESGREYAGRIQAASERMSALIDDLLVLSRVSRAAMNLSQVDLSAEFTAIAGQLQSSEPDRRIRLRVQDGVTATADRTLIRTVLQNLAENAWKFTSRRDDATIEFGTAAIEDASICCYVRDNGAGFEQAYAGKLFQPFQRLHAASEFPGTGIGLASVQRIIERHGGHVWAKGAVDAGATFYFTLNAKDPA